MSLLVLASEGHPETALDILMSVPHLVAHFTLDALTGLILYPAFKWIYKRALKKHDAEFHSGDHDHGDHDG